MPVPSKPFRKPTAKDIARFVEKATKGVESACWEWTGRIDRAGYVMESPKKTNGKELAARFNVSKSLILQIVRGEARKDG